MRALREKGCVWCWWEEPTAGRRLTSQLVVPTLTSNSGKLQSTLWHYDNRGDTSLLLVIIGWSGRGALRLGCESWHRGGVNMYGGKALKAGPTPHYMGGGGERWLHKGNPTTAIIIQWLSVQLAWRYLHLSLLGLLTLSCSLHSSLPPPPARFASTRPATTCRWSMLRSHTPGSATSVPSSTTSLVYADSYIAVLVYFSTYTTCTTSMPQPRLTSL